jgi:hypothetical protein
VEHDRRTDQAGYREGYEDTAPRGAGYQSTDGQQRPDQDYEPSDSGYDPAIDGPEGRDPTWLGQATSDPVIEPVDRADAYHAADGTDADVVDAGVVDAEVVEDPVATATTSGGPEGALPEDVVAADMAPGAVAASADDRADASPDAVAGATELTSTGTATDLVADPEALLARWQEVQVSFVDDPRDSVRTADALVQEVIEHMRQRFMAERAEMEQQWSSGDEASTEDMRLLLQKYRTFFNRLIRV